MMKLTIIVFLTLFCSFTYAECTAEQNAAKIDVLIDRGSESVKAGGEHGYMDLIMIHAPAEVLGLPITKMELTEGEVESFWVPVAFNIYKDKAITGIRGFKDSIKDFEIAIYYGNKDCKKSVQISL